MDDVNAVDSLRYEAVTLFGHWRRFRSSYVGPDGCVYPRHNSVRHDDATDSTSDSILFVRHYSGPPCWFLLLPIVICLSSRGTLLPSDATVRSRSISLSAVLRWPKDLCTPRARHFYPRRTITESPLKYDGRTRSSGIALDAQFSISRTGCDRQLSRRRHASNSKNRSIRLTDLRGGSSAFDSSVERRSTGSPCLSVATLTFVGALRR